ncbi:MAG: glycoside hydrolase family 43 protein [Roseburia sp.]|nr:glycoside hydrolase family 43 protein [Roseburia sp.]
MGYLFVHFVGEEENGEQIYFSLSQDGLHWQDQNAGKPVLYSRIGEQGVRDPFLVTDDKRQRYYLMATDLRIGAGKGWDAAQYQGSRDIIVWESPDLVHWEEARSVTVGVAGAGCAWAPESIYDREKKQFFVFWASMIKLPGEDSAKQRIYGSYTKDFRDFTEPFLYCEEDGHLIDMTIVEENGWYYRFIKDGSTNTIRMDRSRNLTGDDYEVIDAETLGHLYGVEGPECYPLEDGKWCLIVDQFATGKGYLPLICSSLEKGDFVQIPFEEFDLGMTKKRHGGVLKLTETEFDRIRDVDTMARWERG